MFENPRRGRQARNFTTNVLKILHLKSSSEQIFNWHWVPLISGTLCLKHVLLFLNGFGIHLNGSGYLFQKSCHPFAWLGLSVWKKMSSFWTAWAIRSKKKKLMSSVWTAWAVHLEKIVICANGLGYPFQKIVIRLDGRAIRLKKKLSTVGGTEPICSKINFSQISIPKPFHL